MADNITETGSLENVLEERSLDSKALVKGLETGEQSLLLNDIRGVGNLLSLDNKELQTILQRVPLRYEQSYLGFFAAAYVVIKHDEHNRSFALIRYAKEDLLTSQEEFDRWTRIEEFVHYTQAALNPKVALSMARQQPYFQAEIEQKINGVSDASMLMQSNLRRLSEKAFDDFAISIDIAPVGELVSDGDIRLAVKTALGLSDEKCFTYGQAENLYKQLLQPEFASLIKEYGGRSPYGSFSNKDLKSIQHQYKYYSEAIRSTTDDEEQRKFYVREKNSIKGSITYSVSSFFEWIMEENKLTTLQLRSVFEKANIPLDSLRYRQQAIEKLLSEKSINQLKEGALVRLQKENISTQELFSLATIAGDGSSYIVRVQEVSEDEKQMVESTIQRELVAHLEKISSFEETLAFLEKDGLSASDVMEIAHLHNIYLFELSSLYQAKSSATSEMITEAKMAIKKYLEEKGAESFDASIKNRLTNALTQSCQYDQRVAVAKTMISADLLLFVDDLPSDPAMRSWLLANPEWMRLQQEALADPKMGPLSAVDINPTTFVENEREARKASKGALSKLYTGEMEGELTSFIAEERSKIACQMSMGMGRQPADIELDQTLHQETIVQNSTLASRLEKIPAEKREQALHQIILEQSSDLIRDENKRRYHDNQVSLLVEPIAKVIAFELIGKPVEEIPFQGSFVDYGPLLNAGEVKVWVKKLQSFLHKANQEEKKSFMQQTTFLGQQVVVRKALGRR